MTYAGPSRADLEKRVGDSSRSRPPREWPSDEVSDNRHRQRWTPVDTCGRSAAGHACYDAGRPRRNLASGRTGRLHCHLAVGVYRAMAILLPLLVQAIASPIGRPAGPGPYLGWEQAMEGRVGKKKNIFLVWFVWPLITLGIYFFVW